MILEIERDEVVPHFLTFELKPPMKFQNLNNSVGSTMTGRRQRPVHFVEEFFLSKDIILI